MVKQCASAQKPFTWYQVRARYNMTMITRTIATHIYMYIICMPITTTTISGISHHHCHTHHYNQQASAAAVADGQLLVVVRMVDDLWYLVSCCFFSP